MKWESTIRWRATHRGLRLEVRRDDRRGGYFWSVSQKELCFGFGDTADWKVIAHGVERELGAARREAAQAAREHLR